MWFFIWYVFLLIVGYKYFDTHLYHTKILPELEKFRIEDGMDKYEAAGKSHYVNVWAKKYIRDIHEHKKLSKKLNKPELDYSKLVFFYKYRFVIAIIYMAVGVFLLQV